MTGSSKQALQSELPEAALTVTLDASLLSRAGAAAWVSGEVGSWGVCATMPPTDVSSNSGLLICSVCLLTPEPCRAANRVRTGLGKRQYLTSADDYWSCADGWWYP